MQFYNDFTLFNDKTLGKIFLPESLFCKKIIIPTINHGRSIACQIEDYEWILIKGGGWNYGGPSVYISTKDEELVFGLISLKACKREYEVSKALEKISNEFPKVLFYRRFADYDLPPKYDFLKTVQYTSGDLVDPALLYTKVKYPYRVADLMYLTDDEKNQRVRECSEYWKIPAETYIECFARKLADSVAIMHINSFIDDTLEYSNITLLAEIVDYELVTAPGVPLYEGKYDDWRIEARKEKELLYGAEIILQLSHLLHRNLDFYSCYELFVGEYKKINPGFIDNNERVQKILNKEEIIL